MGFTSSRFISKQRLGERLRSIKGGEGGRKSNQDKSRKEREERQGEIPLAPEKGIESRLKSKKRRDSKRKKNLKRSLWLVGHYESSNKWETKTEIRRLITYHHHKVSAKSS